MNYKKYFWPAAPLKYALGWGINLLLPPRCPISGEIVERVGAISPSCWKELTFITDPKCACCGIPFPTDATDLLGQNGAGKDESLKCGACLASPPPYDAARSVFSYDTISRRLILAFKHGDALHLHTSLVPLLKQTAQEWLSASDAVIVPVPLHWRRLLKRRYNQSAILGNELAKLSTIPCYPDAMIRTRHTPPQGHKNAKDRHRNVAGVFDVNPAYTTKLKDKNIVLVDDVFTTGATVEECAKVLKAAGAENVFVLTIARVTKN